MDKATIQQALDRHQQWRQGHADGQRAVFTSEDLREYNFAGSDLTSAQFVACDLRGADFQQCNLSFAHFTCCDLGEANLRGIQAAGVNFHGSDLRQADLRNAFTGIGSSFSAADLRGARMEGAHFKKTDFHSAWMHAGDIRGVRFEEVFAPSWKPLHGTFDSPIRSAELADKLQRKKVPPETANSPLVQAYEQGSGPSLWARLEAANKLEAASANEGSTSLAELKAHGNAQQTGQRKDRDREPER